MNIESLSYSQAQNVVKAHTKSLLDFTNNSTNMEICIETYVQDLCSMNLIKENWIDPLIEYCINNCLSVDYVRARNYLKRY